MDLESASASPLDPWNAPVAVVRAISDTPERELLTPTVVTGGIRALRALRSAAPAIGGVGHRRCDPAGCCWHPPPSFCAGVERAVETVRRALEVHGAPVYVRRQIVHNRHVVEDLEAEGAVFVHELDEVPDGAVVVFSAHGVSRGSPRRSRTPRAAGRGRHLPARRQGAPGAAPLRGHAAFKWS